MEDNKQTGSTVFSWALIGVAFIVIIFFLLIKFLNTGREGAESQSREKLSGYVNTWAYQLKMEVDLAKDFCLIYSDMLEAGSEFASDDMILSAKAMSDRTGISHILFVDKGKLVSDESGNKSNALDLSMFTGDEIAYSYLYDNGYEGTAAVAVYVPMTEGDKYIVCLLNTEWIANTFVASGFEDSSFLALINRQGEIIDIFPKFRDTDSTFLQDKSILEGVEEGCRADEFSTFRVRMNNGMETCVSSTYKGDARTLSFASAGLNDWVVVFGVREASVNKLVKNSFDEAKETVIKLIIVIVVFAIFAVSMMVFNQLKSKERGRALEDKADTDLLTELNNKAATERKIQEYLEENPDGRAMMFILDIDNFKKINDTMGHAFGDTLLKTLGKEIKTEFRMTDIIGRTGGDEFMVFLKDVTDDMIVEREANRITRFFHDFKAGGDYVKYSATASIGAAIFPDDAKSFKELYIAADQALYRAKKRGKNQLVFYNEASQK